MISTITTIIGVLIGIYEVLSRVVKTNKTWSIIGKVIEWLKAISDFLDNKTKK